MAIVQSDRQYGIRSLLATNSTVIFVESLVVFGALWEVTATTFGVEETISSPTNVGESIWQLLVSGEAATHLTATLERVAWALLLAIVIGTVFGVLVGWGDFWKRTFEDYILSGIAFPPILGAIIAAIWFGVSDLTPIVASALLTFPYLSQNVAKAVENVDGDLIEMSAAFDVTTRRVVWRLVLRSILPEWFAGLRYTFAVCWKIVTVAEFVALSSGVGYMIGKEMAAFSMAGVLAWTIVFSAFAMFIEYGVLQPIENRAFEWRDDTSIAGGVA
ncbi:MAG: ABC transporter permease [Salinigranum sp.]